MSEMLLDAVRIVAAVLCFGLALALARLAWAVAWASRAEIAEAHRVTEERQRRSTLLKAMRPSHE